MSDETTTGKEAPGAVRYEPVPPFHTCTFGIAGGETVTIDLAGLWTSDPTLIDELDRHSDRVRRSASH